MKVFVLGLDGATFDCLNPLMEEGVIPNLREMCLTGAYGPMRTIFPPVTAPAWLALATGLNPGKTGVFDYINRTDAKSHHTAPISSAYYEKRSLWDFLNDNGRTVGIFNYPTLSPPPAVKGFSISGIGAYKRENLCFPAELERDLDRITGGYESRLSLRSIRYKKDIGLFFDDIDRIITKQAAALNYLVKEKEWDFFFAVFSFTDWMQHVLWKFIDEGHPLHDPKDSSAVKKRYRETWHRIDCVIGELRHILNEHTAFMIVSDHGAGPIDSVFYPNTWLEEMSWLKRKRIGWKSFIVDNVRLFSDGSDSKYVNKFLHILKTRILNIKSTMELIDYEKSLAYCPEHNTMFGCISLTERGKARKGFKEELIRELQILPEKNNGIEKMEICLPEDIYTGPLSSLSPDIFFIVNGYRSTVEVDFARHAFVRAPSIEMRTGGHTPDGVLICSGDVFQPTLLKGVSILDVAPTVLALYRVEIPYQMDGRVITDCLRPDIPESGDFGRRADVNGDVRQIDEKGDMDEMKKMLKSLGYM